MDKWRRNTQYSHLTSHVSRLISHTGLMVILAIFFILTTLHSLIVPLTQGEDELAHYRYLSFIAQKGRLPINDAEREQAWYRADWPPLYHLLVGWMVSPIDTTQPHLKDVGESSHRRLVGEIFYPRLIIYTEDANWPWQDGILAWYIGRFISILFSAGALVFTYFTVLEMCRGAEEQGSKGTREQRNKGAPLQAERNLSACVHEDIGQAGAQTGNIFRFSPKLFALIVTAILAFTPRYLFTSAMLGDDSLFILLSAIFIWLLLRALRGHDRWWVYAVLGLLLGLSIATKYSTAFLPLVIIPVALWRARQAGWRWQQWLGRVAIAWGGTLIGAGWWFGWIGYYFNTIKENGPIFGLLSPLLNAGPDVSMRRIFTFFTDTAFTGQERPDAIEAGTFWDWLTYLFQTFWGVPVLEHDPLFPWAYLLMLVFCLLALFGLRRLWRTVDGETRVMLGILALIVALLFPFPMLRFFLTHNVLETGQGRHILYPAAQAIPILLGLGWVTVSPYVPRTTHYALRDASRFTFYVLFPPFLLLLWSIFQLIYMTITYPAPLPVQTTTFNSASIPHSLKHNFGDDIQLLGYDFTPDPEQGSISLTLFWQSLNPVHENYRSQIQLVDPNGQPHLTWLSHPLNGRYPTRAWDKGDVVRDELSLPLAALSPELYTLQLNLLHEAEDTPLSNEALAIMKFDLPTRQPLVNASTLSDVEYRLWVDNNPARYRQTLPLSWDNHDDVAQNLTWTLLGPDNVPRLPAATGDATAIFIVGADWPSGDYRLQLQQNDSERLQTEPLQTVANEARLFSLPPRPEGFIPVEATFAASAGEASAGEAQIKLLGYVLPTRRIEPGSGLPLTLYWQSLAPVLGDYIVFDVLLAENQQVYGGYDRLPREYYSTILWAEGEVVEDGFAVPVSPDAPPGIYHLRVGLYSLATGSPVSLPFIHDGQLTDVTSIVIGPIKVGGPPPDVTTNTSTPQVTLKQPFSHQVTLFGYDVSTGDDAHLKLTFYWQAETKLQTDYTTFVHLRDASNQTVAQKDSPPANGRYPTSLWDVDEIIVDEIMLSLDQVPPGQYTPVVGLYDPITGDRLLIEGIPENELRLENVTLP